MDHGDHRARPDHRDERRQEPLRSSCTPDRRRLPCASKTLDRWTASLERSALRFGDQAKPRESDSQYNFPSRYMTVVPDRLQSSFGVG
jgi:hypothetical protein